MTFPELYRLGKKLFKADRIFYALAFFLLFSAFLLETYPEAAAAIKALDAPKNRTDRRKKTNRYYFRLTDDQAKKLDRLLKKLGYSTVQSFCEALIRQEVSRNGI